MRADAFDEAGIAMPRWMLTAVALFMLALPQPAAAACGHDLVEVAGDEEEIAVACEALEGVLAYFAEAGYLYAQERGGMAFIKLILAGEVEVGTGETSHICPWK